MIPRKKPTPKEVRGLIALRYKIAREAFRIVKRARRNPKLLEKLKAWAISLTTTNCAWAEYAIVRDMMDQGLLQDPKEAAAA